MAALNTIAKEWADEIRDGIAWVIIWKTGRSWNAEAVWLNPDDDTFELGDLDTARTALEQDPNAVMLNGYYCGHLGENMTLAEIEAGIRWHYNRHANLLKDSSAFPPEPLPRPADLPADIPWYGKASNAELDPYIFDGYMSVEDYDRMHELMAAEPGIPEDILLNQNLDRMDKLIAAELGIPANILLGQNCELIAADRQQEVEDMYDEEPQAGEGVWLWTSGPKLVPGEISMKAQPFSPDPAKAQTIDGRCKIGSIPQSAPTTIYLDGEPLCFSEAALPAMSIMPDLSGVPPSNTLEPESMELTFSITPQTAATIAEAMRSAFAPIIQKAKEAFARIVDMFRKAAKVASKTARKAMDTLLYAANDNSKWWHLYKHAKKARVRKKYRRRLMQQLFDKLRASPSILEVIT